MSSWSFFVWSARHCDVIGMTVRNDVGKQPVQVIEMAKRCADGFKAVMVTPTRVGGQAYRGMMLGGSRQQRWGTN